MIGSGISIRYIAVEIDSVVTVGTRDIVSRNANRLSVYPNPMVDQSSISFELAASDRAKIVVADASRRQVAVVMDQQITSGKQQVTWNRDNQLIPGFYFVQLYLDGSLQGLAKVIVR